MQRRILYLMVLLGSVVFYLAYREWLSGFLLTAVALLPVLSLALSLPAMITCRAELQCPPHLTLDAPGLVAYSARCRLPIPELKGSLELLESFTGKKKRIRFGSQLPAGHCGALVLRRGRLWMCDYLGLVSLPVARLEPQTVLVRPKPLKPARLPDLTRYLCNASRPKPGGGYSENHELRLYRPGDNLRQIHWKLSAKTGKLIIREPMEPLKGSAMLTMELSGTQEKLDEKLGQLLFMSCYLIEQQVPHRICCLTGSGMQLLAVGNETEAVAAVDALLRCTPLREDLEPHYPSAAWRFHIGGERHE